jgi:hypothetical protein
MYPIPPPLAKLFLQDAASSNNMSLFDSPMQALTNILDDFIQEFAKGVESLGAPDLLADCRMLSCRSANTDHYRSGNRHDLGQLDFFPSGPSHLEAAN